MRSTSRSTSGPCSRRSRCSGASLRPLVRAIPRFLASFRSPGRLPRAWRTDPASRYLLLFAFERRSRRESPASGSRTRSPSMNDKPGRPRTRVRRRRPLARAGRGSLPRATAACRLAGRDPARPRSGRGDPSRDLAVRDDARARRVPAHRAGGPRVLRVPDVDPARRRRRRAQGPAFRRPRAPRSDRPSQAWSPPMFAGLLALSDPPPDRDSRTPRVVRALLRRSGHLLLREVRPSVR